MTINQAVRLRINDLLEQNNMTQYRLEQNSGVSHGLLGCIMRDRNKNVTLKTIIMIAGGFNMSLTEFLDCPCFDSNKLDLE